MGSQSAGIGSALPDQTGYSGYILTTDGVTASWEASSASLPSQTGNSGKFLTTNGTTASWASVTATSLLPDQTGNSGKVLSTDGAGVLSWIDAAGLSLGAFSAAPSTDGLTLAAGVLNLDPADGTRPGGVSTTTQTFAGVKTFSSVPVAAGLLAPTTSELTLQGQKTDGASAIGIIIDAKTALTTSGAKIVSFQTAETEKAYVDKDGMILASAGDGVLMGKGPGGAVGIWMSGASIAPSSSNWQMALYTGDLYINGLTSLNFRINGNAVGSFSTTTLDLTALGTGGAIKLKDAGGTDRTVTITAGGAWSIV